MGATGDGVEISEIPKPTPSPGNVRVKVIASAVNAGEEKVIGGDFVGRFLHAKTSPLILGWDVSGTVDALGKGVTDLDERAAVWGHLAYSPSQTQAAFAEYVALPREALAAKPDDVPYHVAAAAATVAMTSLQSLRDLSGLGEGGTALIIGAGGGIGSVGVGIGKRLGGRVTGVCSTKDVARIEALGADAVIDRKQSDPLDADAAYDVVFDTPAVHSFSRCAKILRAGGTYVTTLPDAALVTGIARTVHLQALPLRPGRLQTSGPRVCRRLAERWARRADRLASPDRRPGCRPQTPDRSRSGWTGRRRRRRGVAVVRDR